MNVGFNPQVSFKSDTNLIAAKVNDAQKPQTVVLPDSFTKSPEVRFPDSWETEEVRQKKNEEALKSITAALEEGKSLDGIIKGTHWEKEYNRFDNTVHMKIPNSYDGNEYTIYPNGKVIVTNGWGKNEVKMDANEKMANYVKALRDGKVDEFLEKEYNAETETNAEVKAEVTESADKSKADLFKETLHNREWKKEYLPESDIIVIRHKRIKDGTDYMMEKDGTVKEFGLRIKPTVIIEPSIEGAKEFGKLKAKLSGENDEVKTSLWYKMKKAVASVWKFCQVTGTMSVATAKGIAEGVVVGAGVLAGTTILRGLYKVIATDTKLTDVAKHPLKTAGKAGGLLAVAAGGAVLAAEVIAGRMKANQQSAVIEHKLDVAHDLS